MPGLKMVLIDAHILGRNTDSITICINLCTSIGWSTL